MSSVGPEAMQSKCRQCQFLELTVLYTDAGMSFPKEILLQVLNDLYGQTQSKTISMHGDDFRDN